MLSSTNKIKGHCMFSKDSQGKLLEYVINLTAARVLVPVIQIMNMNYSEDSSHTRIRHSRNELISEENSEMKPSTDLLPTSKEHQKTFTKKSLPTTPSIFWASQLIYYNNPFPTHKHMAP
ncbi:hypothetical protein L798_13953 [Zootermopsis nevadensis]|uniref:Uncharacterized protein n=1 Tax=Zootermopsis nevadensis TaxID=136037 RepID=A0A067QSA0_ZOONE|nr:hypothetical protein L798_13953 [Zootermopsis nevadensis]